MNRKPILCRTFLPELESLRGLAAVHVAIGHWYIVTAAQITHQLSAGTAYAVVEPIAFALMDPQPTVLLFFVLSGVVLATQLEQSPVTGVNSYVGFLCRRLCRIYPGVFASIIVSYAAAAITVGRPPAHQVLEAALVQFTPLNVVLWSLGVELAGSAVLPLMHGFLLRSNWTGQIIALSGLALLSRMPLWPLATNYLVFFSAGSLIRHRGGRDVTWSGWSMGAALALALVVFFVSPHLTVSGLNAPDHWQAWLLPEIPACSTIVALACLSGESAFGRFLRLRTLRFSGRISFGIYLFHFPLLLMFWRFWHPDQHGGRVALQVFAATLAATLAIAIPHYFWVERPFIALGRRIANRLSGSARAVTQPGTIRIAG